MVDVQPRLPGVPPAPRPRRNDPAIMRRAAGSGYILNAEDVTPVGPEAAETALAGVAHA